MRRLFNFFFALFFFLPFVTLAQEVESAVDREPAARGIKVRAITVKGNRKIESSAVTNKIVSKVGESYSKSKIREDIQAIFDSGYFIDIRVEEKRAGGGVSLTYFVKEKPTIQSVSVEGNDELDEEEILEGIDIKAYQILDRSKLVEAVEKIEKLYEDKGFYLARVNFKAIEEKDGSNADVVFTVEENEMVKVAEIRFLGNNQLGSTKLKSFMETKEGGFFSFMSGSGAYKRDAFDRDIQRLNFLYFNEGFVQVKIDRPEVFISPDKRNIIITIRVQEGEKFNVGTVDFSGDLLFSEEELMSVTQLKTGDLFVYEKLQKDIGDLTAKYGDLGYAYANVIPRNQVREKEKIVDIIYDIDKGPKVYIGKINVVGNTKTRDKVLRREMKIHEGELYNETKRRESLANIKRLGFFEEVVFNTKTPKNDPNKMDIDIVVKERNTGTIQVGAGFSSYSGFVLNGQVNQINFLGKGQKLGASINYSEKQWDLTFSFTEPYFSDTKWSLGGDVYIRKRILTEYREEKNGASVTIGHPLAPYLNGFIGYKLDDTTIDLSKGENGEGDPQLFPVDTVNGFTSAVTLGVTYDKRNDRFAPTDGLFGSLSFEYAGLGGDLKYTKGLASFKYYKKVFWDLVWRNNLNYGFISSNNDKDPPFNQLFLLGGANTLRGYRWFTVGRRKFSNKALSEAISGGHPDPNSAALRPFGGTQQFYYNLEFEFPLIEEAGVKGVVFYDIGNADNSLLLSDLRSDYGFGFRWFSPIGPLRFEWGFPIDRRVELDEDSMNFNFMIGAPF